MYPRRGEEDDVDLEMGQDVDCVAHNEFNPLFHPVDLGVVLRDRDSRRVDVDRNHMRTHFGKPGEWK